MFMYLKKRNYQFIQIIPNTCKPNVFFTNKQFSIVIESTWNESIAPWELNIVNK